MVDAVEIQPGQNSQAYFIAGRLIVQGIILIAILRAAEDNEIIGAKYWSVVLGVFDP